MHSCRSNRSAMSAVEQASSIWNLNENDFSDGDHLRYEQEQE